MTLVSLLESHYKVFRIVSEGYECSIRNVIRNYERFRSALPNAPATFKATIEDLSDDRLREFAAWLVATKRSRATVNKSLRTLIALANFAREHGLTTYRPDIAKLPEARQRPVAWRPEEFSALIGSIHKTFGNTPWGSTLYVVVMLIYDTGVRVIDSLRLESTPAHFARNIVFVTERKTQKRRAFVIHEDTRKALLATYGAFTGGSVVKYGFRETQPLRRRLKQALAAADLPTDRKQLFQKIRRTTASEFNSRGGDARKLLGHSAQWVTESFYIDADSQTPMDAANSIPRPNTG
jgi:integrase